MTKATVRAAFAVAGLISMFAAGGAMACDALDRQIEKAPEKLASYSETGKFQDEIDGAGLEGKRVVGCSEVNSSLVKVALAPDGVWIDITKVKLVPLPCDERSGAAEPEKLEDSVTRPKPSTALVTSGIGPCEQS